MMRAGDHSGTRLTVSAVLALCLICALAGCTGGSASRQQSVVAVFAASERRAAPPLRGELLGGDGTFDLSGHAGAVVVVNFWASWCAPCVLEAEDLERTYQATKDGNVTFLGVNVRDDRDPAIAFERGRVSYPSVFDPSSRLALGFSVPPTGIPSTIVIDRRGRVAVVIRRPVLRSELEPIVAQIAAEPR